MLNQKPQILLVDDDRDIIAGASVRLRACGYQTLAAYDGEQGVNAALEHLPDAIVLDVRMPRMDGLAALAMLNECQLTRRIPIIMLSASVVDQQAALDAGARFFLTKPYQGKTLVTAIDTALSETKPQPGDSDSCPSPTC